MPAHLRDRHPPVGAVCKAPQPPRFGAPQSDRPSTRSTQYLLLNAGVPATEVARRAGHGVAVMLAVYANCIDGQDDAVNGRIEHALTGDPYVRN